MIENVNENSGVVSSVRKAQMRGVPIIAVNTPDNSAFERRLRDRYDDAIPILAWDCIRGFRPVNDSGASICEAKKIDGQGQANPIQAVNMAAELPRCIVVAHNFHNYVVDGRGSNPGFLQAMQNARDTMSKNQVSFVMVGYDFDGMSEDVEGDVIRYEDLPPGREKIGSILFGLLDDVETSKKSGDPDFVLERPQGAELQGIVNAAIGLPNEFMIAQAMALSFDESGRISESTLWGYKDSMLNAVSGLSVYRSTESFDDLGGLDSAKGHFRRLVNGRGRPSAFFWLDEPEKSGLTSTEDTSGVNKDQLGTALKLIEDYQWRGIVFLGLPGVAKSQFCKCLNGEFDLPVLAGDLGACKNELVGKSERNIRKMFNTVYRVGGSDVVVILTANSIEALDDALKSRFPKMYYFDLPSTSEKSVIWDIQCKRFGIPRTQVTAVDDEGWSGRNIRNCCREAFDSERDLSSASEEIVPEAFNSRNKIDKIRGYANHTLLSASYPGLYNSRRSNQEAEGRSMSFDN